MSSVPFKLDHVLLMSQDSLTSDMKCVISDQLWSFDMEEGKRGKSRGD